MLIKVKREHIDGGGRRDRAYCPIVLAIRDAMPDAYHVAVDSGYAVVYRFRGGKHQWARLRLPGAADVLQQMVDGVIRRGGKPGREWPLSEINPIAFDFPENAFT